MSHSPDSGAAPAAPPRVGTGEDGVSGEAFSIERLRAGEVAAFTAMVQRYHASMTRVALGFVPSPAVAEEVVQETWLAVCKGLAQFEGRASLRTWLFSILVNRARTRGQRERRALPFSALANAEGEDAAEASVLFASDGTWATPPRSWGAGSPEDMLLQQEMTVVLERAIAALPDRYRIIVTLRDIEELPSADVCDLLDITEQNQRVLLHRGRARLRTLVEAHLLEGEPR